MSTPVPTVRELRIADRCDRCGAQAYLLVELLNEDGHPSELLFCRHHGNQHEEKLRERAVMLHDHRDKVDDG